MQGSHEYRGPLRAERGNLRVRRSGSGGERGLPRPGSPHRLMSGLPGAEVGEPPSRWSTGFISWPTDMLRPTRSLQARLALRIAEGKREATRCWPPAGQWPEPDWEQVRARDRMQAAGERCGKAPGQHAGAPGAGRELSGGIPHAGRGGAASAPTVSCGSTSGKLFPRATTTAVSLERATNGSGARRGCTCLLTTSTKDTLR